MPLPYLKRLSEYWLTEYDWRAAEKRINSFPQFITEIDGAEVHYLHVRSPEPNAMTLLLTHGWPGSFTEFLDLIGPLHDPRRYGADGRTAFNLVIPSIPGFGFSSPLCGVGWNIRRVASAWAELMQRLGYDNYLAQGGDAGSAISLELARVDPDHVAGVHVNMLMTFPDRDGSDAAELSDADSSRIERLIRFDTELSGYMKLQSTRPNTLSYALADSPVGQLAWIVERFRDWTECRDAPEEAVSIDSILTIVTIYWLTNTATSSAQLYYEDAANLKLTAEGATPPAVTVPIGVAVFPHDMIVPLRKLAFRDYPSISRWTEFDHGGHFAALEQPELLVKDIREFAQSLPGGR